MKINNIRSKVLKEEEFRFNAKPYCSAIFECRDLIESLTEKKEKLCNLTDAIFNGPRFKRNWVIDPRFGIGLISGSDMLQSRLNRLDMISINSVSQMKEMILGDNTVLISSYGTVGRCVFVRPDMSGSVGSDNVMKVVFKDGVYPGYIFSFLKSKYGIPLVVHGTNGGVVPFLEPKRVFNIEIPIFQDLMANTHNLIIESTKAASESAKLFELAGSKVNSFFKFPNKLALNYRVTSTSTASSLLIQKRMDATYHDEIAQMSDDLVEQTGAVKTLAELGVKTGESGRMKLIFTESDHGVPFSTSGEIFRARYEPQRFLAKSKLGDVADWGVRQEDVLLARSGQVGGIIGTGVWADSRFENAAVSVDVIRVKAQESEVLPGYLYAYLMCTDVGYRQLIRSAAGSSIPHLSSDDVLKLKLPRMGGMEEKAVHELVKKAGELAAEAQKLEDEAVKMVEDAIEAAAPKH